jgi:hypothetical protein
MAEIIYRGLYIIHRNRQRLRQVLIVVLLNLLIIQYALLLCVALHVPELKYHLALASLMDEDHVNDFIDVDHLFKEEELLSV